MNLEKLAKHLKEFTLDEIEMIAECDCKTELEQLLNEDKLVFEQGLYKFKESEQSQTFEFIAKPKIYKNKNLNDITCYDIQEFYYFCKGINLPPKVLKNTLALLNQMIKYFQNLGIIDRTCNFQVRRLSDKTNFTLDRIIMEA